MIRLPDLPLHNKATAAMRAARPDRPALRQIACRHGDLDHNAFGVPFIKAASRLDAVWLQGLAVAADRLFQMDLLRRTTAGRLAELLGESALDSDRRARVLGFRQAAAQAWQALARPDRELLTAYADGVNAWMRSREVPAFEYALLDCEPEPWTGEDCLLVQLHLFDLLCGEYHAKRTTSILHEALPPRLAAFLSCDEDVFTHTLCGGDAGRRPGGAAPIDDLATLAAGGGFDPWRSLESLHIEGTTIGSNCWAARDALQDNRALLANDLHLPLKAPGPLYLVGQTYENSLVRGNVVPGFPVVISGSNGKVCWGVTNLCGDNLDLVRLEQSPGRDEYRTASGWQRFSTRDETIAVHRRASVKVQVRETCWGPVVEQPLLGHEIAVRWLALDPRAVDLGLAGIETSNSTGALLDAARGCGTVPLNVIACDTAGVIGWTIAGRFPVRTGTDHHRTLDGARLTPQPCALVPRDEQPKIVGPAASCAVTANNRVVGAEHAHDFGRNFATGCRALHIHRRLQSANRADAAYATGMQLDESPMFYDFYRDLLLPLLESSHESWAQDAASALRDMHGDARVGAAAFASRVRDAICGGLLNVWLRPCVERDPDFRYAWANYEASVRSVLALREPQTFPFGRQFASWDEYLLRVSERSRQELLASTGAGSVTALRWEHFPGMTMRHPLSAQFPELASLLDLHTAVHRGASFMVRVAGPEFGAASRLVARAGEAPWIQMPGGQSGNPSSAHYRDMHQDWLLGRPRALALDAAAEEDPE